MRLNDDIGIDSIYQATKKFIYPPKSGSISVTDLINPPLIRKLKLEHWDDIEENVSDRVWAIFGQAIHTIMEKADSDPVFKEHFMELDFEGTKIRGVLDQLSQEGATHILQDFKVPSVWAYIYGFDPTYEQAMNIYRYMLYKLHDIDCEKAEMIVIFRDWKKNEYMKRPDEYPPKPIMRIPVACWSYAEVESFITLRLHKHKEVEWCTPEEQWKSPDQWAVMKDGRKSAIRVLDDPDAAAARLAQEQRNGKGRFYIQERKGVAKRCAEYCPVREFCPQRADEG